MELSSWGFTVKGKYFLSKCFVSMDKNPFKLNFYSKEKLYYVKGKRKAFPVKGNDFMSKEMIS